MKFSFHEIGVALLFSLIVFISVTFAMSSFNDPNEFMKNAQQSVLSNDFHQDKKSNRKSVEESIIQGYQLAVELEKNTIIHPEESYTEITINEDGLFITDDNSTLARNEDLLDLVHDVGQKKYKYDLVVTNSNNRFIVSTVSDYEGNKYNLYDSTSSEDRENLNILKIRNIVK